jgi:diguanylate cyclase (GGDEF)-like protein/PAS domain S-box-containing protein
MDEAALSLLGPLTRGSDVLALYSPWAAKLLREHGLPAARTAGSWQGELALRGASGALLTVSQTIFYHSARQAGAGQYSLVFHTPQAGEAAEAAARIAALLEGHPDPAWVYDAETLRILLVNPAAIHHYGYSEQELLAMTVLDLRAQPFGGTGRSRPSMLGGLPERAGMRYHMKKDGTPIIVEISSHAMQFCGKSARMAIYRDVSMRVRREAMQRAVQETQRQVIDHVPQEIFWKDCHSVYLGCNKVFARAAGLDSSAEIVGKTDAELPWAARAGLIRSEDQRVIASGTALLNREESFITRDGSTCTFMTNHLPLHDEEGVIVGTVGTLEDITHLKRAELRLQLQGHAIEASVNAIVITASYADQPTIEYANPAFLQLSGYRTDEITGRTLEFLLDEGDGLPDTDDLAALRAAFRGQGERTILLRNFRKDGSSFWSQLHVAPVRQAEVVSHHVCVLNDMTEVIEYQAQLERQANHDALTGLPNRKLFGDRLEQAVAYAQRFGHAFWVAFIDLDNFKLINDTLGHHRGDELLRHVGTRLRACARESDTVARLGGDEFILLLHDAPQGHLSDTMLQKIIDSLTQPYQLGNQELVVTCSVGVSLFPKDSAEVQQLLKQADIAMYRAKECGRNRIQFYEPAMDARIAERSLIEKQLRHAMARGQLSLDYQPRVDLRTGQVSGMEALLRWRHPELGDVPPSRFIGVAEETGLIVPIGAWVLRTACAQNAAWQAAGLPCFRVAVNLSARQFQDQGLAGHILSALADSGLAPAYLELELTESVMMENVEAAVSTLRKLKRLGVALSIDDFGTGYSSLAYLKSFPLDYLKIDKSFVHDMLGDPNGAAIVRSVVALGHSLNFRIIAEGVETAAQLAYLARYQCDEIQGFFFNRPVSADEFGVLLREAKSLPNGPAQDSRQPILLLVDESARVQQELSSLLIGDNYLILHARTQHEAFDLLALHDVQVIVSGQGAGAPANGADNFLKRVKQLYPGTVRVLLSESCDLDTILAAINGGEIYRFCSGPCHGEVLREHIRDAFAQYRLIHGQGHTQVHVAGEPARGKAARH